MFLLCIMKNLGPALVLVSQSRASIAGAGESGILHLQRDQEARAE